MDISLETWNTQDTIHISNDAQEEGRSPPPPPPNPGKAQCSSVREFQVRKVGRGGLGNRGGKRAYGTSAVKSTDCSSEGPEFKSQQPHGGSQPSVMRSDTLFWCALTYNNK